MKRHPLLRLSPGLVLLATASLCAAYSTAQEPAAPASRPAEAPLALVGAYPLPGTLFGDSIVFYFNQPLAPVTDPSTLIQIVPPLRGTWSQGAYHIALAVGPEAAQDRYRATFLPALTGAGGEPPLLPAEPLLFSNFELTLKNLSYGAIGTVSTNLQLAFTAPVPWEQLQQHLGVTDSAGQAVQYTCPRRSPTSSFLVAVPTLASAPYTVAISSGLTDASGKFQTQAEIRQSLPPQGNFTISDVVWRHESPETDRVSLRLSYPLDYDDFVTHFAVYAGDGTDSLVLERGKPGEKNELVFLLARPAEPYSALRYEFTPGLEQIPALFTQAALSGTVTLQRDALRIDYHNWDTQGLDPMRLQLYFNSEVDPSELKKHLTVMPALADLDVAAGPYGSVDITGDWQTGKPYAVVISEGLADRQDVMAVSKPLTWSAGQAPKRSGAGFAFEAPYYFPRRQAGPLKLYAQNLKRADVTLYQLFPSNLVQALGEMQEGKSPGSFGYDLGRKIGSKTVTFPDVADTRVEAALPLDGFMPGDLKGIFGLSLSPGYDYYNTKILVWTDIGVLAHWQEDQVLIYAHNLWNLAPLEGATVTLYSVKHQVMGTAATGADGVARLGGWDPELGRPKAAIVETADDFTFLPLNERSEDPVAYTDTMPDYRPDGYDAFLYADRNLYRPGETMHVRWLVRQADGSPLAEAPLKLRVVDSKESAHDYTYPLSKWGSGTADVETTRTWLTGAYRLELWVPGATSPLATQTVNVEDFVPNRISAKVTAGAAYWLPGEEHPITVKGEQLSGGPARERKTGAVVILEKKPWKPEQWPDYTFSNEAPFNTDVRDLGEATTDGLGEAGYTFAWHPAKDLSAPLEATLRGEVFELGGRGVSARTSTYVFPAPAVVGLAAANGTAPNSLDVAVAAVQPDGSAAPLESAIVTLEKKQWSYYVRRYSSHNEANWSDDFLTLQTETVPLVNGKGSITLSVPEGYGTYRIKVQGADSPQYATQSFWSYGGRAQLADSSRPSLITLTADKKGYVPGDTATVRIESPFDGNAIVVVQGADIEQALTVPITNGAGTLTLPLEAKHCPNIWLETTVIHPVEPGAPLTYPYASFAMLNIPVQDPSKALAVSFVDLPEVIRPMTQLAVTVNVNSPENTPVASEVTLALVDEGIHQILQYQNPDPVAWFQRNRRPEYRRAHYYDQVAYDFEAAKIGGGELLKKRLGEDDATVDDNWIKPLALWSGAVEVDATGTATITMDIPEFAGKVRLVAVATTGSEAGSQSADVTIRRPVILRTTLPRFVAPGDTFETTVLLQNKQDVPTTATLKASADEPLAMDALEQTWNLAPEEEKMVTIPMRAGELTGSGVIHWAMATANAQGEVVDEYSTDTPLKVQSPTIYQTRAEMAIVPAGETQGFANTEFRENGVLETALYVTPNPLVRVRKALDYVIGYPYGCVEQTTSRCLPLYLLGQAASKTGDDWEKAQFQQFIQAGIDRLISMQTRSGGLGYWPGARDAYPYGSIYAAHFLTLAHQDPAFTVPDEAYEKLMAYIRERISLDPTEGYGSLYDYSYACFVRALAKDTTVMEDINRLDAITVSTSARQWLALAALRFTGGADQAQRYILGHPSTPYDTKEQAGGLNSSVRNDAITLMTQMAVGAGSALVQPQAEKLVRYLETHRYSTQEAAFVITALSEYLKENMGDLREARARIVTPDGTEERTADFAFRAKHKGPGGAYTVTNLGPAPLHVYFTSAGILINPDVSSASNGITVNRSFEGKNGPVAADALKHGENYLVTLDVECAEDFENLVVADLLPGGLEIENPRLDGGTLATWKKTGGVVPSFLEMRDDRLIAAFNRLNRGPHRFYYVVRAVTAGTFRQPAANAECMYDGQFNGRTASGSVTVAP